MRFADRSKVRAAVVDNDGRTTGFRHAGGPFADTTSLTRRRSRRRRRREAPFAEPGNAASMVAMSVASRSRL